MSIGDATVTTHHPARPSWRCLTCEDEWPCLPRRTEMIRDADGQAVSVALMMASYLHEAMADHPATPVHVLHLRFLGWVRQDALLHRRREARR